MAGTLEITEQLWWAPAGWAYDNVLKAMAVHLAVDHFDLAARLLDARTDVNGGYLDLRGSDRETLEVLIRAAAVAYRDFEAEGAASWNEPSFYPSFMQGFQNLLDMLRAAYQELVKKESGTS